MMNGEEVFYIHRSVLHWAHQCSAGSYKCLYIWWFVCVIWKQNPILRRNNIVLNVKFHFAGELRGFAHCVCFFGFVCRVLRIWGMLSENVCKQLRKTVKTWVVGYSGRVKRQLKVFKSTIFTKETMLNCQICSCIVGAFLDRKAIEKQWNGIQTAFSVNSP